MRVVASRCVFCSVYIYVLLYFLLLKIEGAHTKGVAETVVTGVYKLVVFLSAWCTVYPVYTSCTS